jgi:hypothetical protein
MMMNSIDKQNAEEWIKRFLDGETSNDEERELYRFFEGRDIPRRLRKYKPMFAWYAGGMQGELPQPVRQRRIRPLIIRLCAAASIILTFGVGLGVYQHYEKLQEEYDCYEGSYIIRNGEKITNIKEILPELRKTSQMAHEQMKEAKEELEKSPEDYLQEIKERHIQQNQGEQNLPVI